MDYLVAHRSHNHYRQLRPMASRHITTMAELDKQVESEEGLYSDCSEDIELICRLSGLKNPSGFDYNSGASNTQTMYDHLPKYTNPRSAGIGALCFFGIPGDLPSQHITAVSHPGPDPILFSHGGSGIFAAHFVLLSDERKFHQGTPIFLSIAGLL